MTRETEHTAHGHMERMCCDGQCNQGRQCVLPPPLTWREELRQMAIAAGLICIAVGAGVIVAELAKVIR